MPLQPELEDIVKKYLTTAAMAGSFQSAKQRAEQGGAEEKLALGRWAEAVILNDNWPLHVPVEPQDYARGKRLLLEYYEDLARQGDPVAMRYAACGYGNGDNALEVIPTENGHRMRAAPDFAKACDWARQAAAAGDNVAQKILPSLERELAGQPRKSPPRP